MTRDVTLTKPVYQGARGRNGAFTVGRLIVQLQADPDGPCEPTTEPLRDVPQLVGIRAQSSREGAQDPLMLYLTPRDAQTLVSELRLLLSHLPDDAPLDGYQKPAAASPVELVK